MATQTILFLCSLGYGITMKMADLLDEHGLKLFKFDALIFGVVWGIFGSLLVILGGTAIANLVLAMNIAFVFRNRLDYPNHRIATGLIAVAFLLFGNFNLILLAIFTLIFFVFGAAKDYLHEKSKLRGLPYLLSQQMLYYLIPTLIYSYIYSDWKVFWVFLIYTVAYNATKAIAKQKGYN